MKIKHLDDHGKTKKTINVKESLFCTELNKKVLGDVISMFQLSRRTSLAATKNRSKIKCSGKKLHRQKGLGVARAGTASSPTRRHGAVTFGPNGRKYVKKIPKKLRKKVLSYSLYQRMVDQDVFIIDSIKLSSSKTKDFKAMVDNLSDPKFSRLVLLNKVQDNVKLASRNLQYVNVKNYYDFSLLDILKYDKILIEEKAFKKLINR